MTSYVRKICNDALARKRDDRQGFTLLETLISLAILSVVSLALFQSTASLLRITDSAVNAGERTLETAIATKTFRVSVGGLIPAWPEDKRNIFNGEASAFTGLSADVPTATGLGVQRLGYRLVSENAKTISLEVEVGGATWVLQELPVNTARFLYLGTDQKWYESWPPAQVPSTGFFNDNQRMKMPQLPIAIRLQANGFEGEGQGQLDWIVSIHGVKKAPLQGDF